MLRAPWLRFVCEGADDVPIGNRIGISTSRSAPDCALRGPKFKVFCRGSATVARNRATQVLRRRVLIFRAATRKPPRVLVAVSPTAAGLIHWVSISTEIMTNSNVSYTTKGALRPRKRANRGILAAARGHGRTATPFLGWLPKFLLKSHAPAVRRVGGE